MTSSSIPDPVAAWMLDEIAGCGDCVVWNGYSAYTPEDPEVGGCSVFGARRRDAEPCRRFFPKHQLNAALYGKGG